jgi:hypothetical protein
MVTQAHSKRRPWLRELGQSLPYASLVAILWGGSSAFRPGPSQFLPPSLFLVIGLVLAMAHFVVVVSQFRTRAWILTVQSAFVAALLMVAAGVVMYLANMISPLAEAALAARGPSLSSVLQDQVEDARVPASAFLETGSKKGSLPGTDWSNPAGGQVPITVGWVRNAEGVLVTASPKGSVPRLQDGTPQRQLFLGADVLAFPLGYFTVEAGHPLGSTFNEWLPMFNRMVDKGASPIIGFARGNGGRLPSVEEADALLAKAGKRFSFYYKRGPKVELVIEAYTYEKKKDGIFEIRFAWSCKYKDRKSSDSSSDAPVTGVISIDFTAPGLMIMERKDGKLQHPLSEILEVYEAGPPQATNDSSSSTSEGSQESESKAAG